MAQEEGFEPPCLLGKRFSRPPRCDRFDIPAYFIAAMRRLAGREGCPVARAVCLAKDFPRCFGGAAKGACAPADGAFWQHDTV